jgi:hypothetical protein
MTNGTVPENQPVSRLGARRTAAETGTDTGSYAHQDLVAMMRRRRAAEDKLRQRQQEAGATAGSVGSKPQVS